MTCGEHGGVTANGTPCQHPAENGELCWAHRANDPAPGGRPSVMTDVAKEAIIERMTLGETLREIAADEEMPSERTVWDHVDANDGDEFSRSFHRAQEKLAESLVYHSLEIADDSSRDAKTVRRRDGSTYKVADTEYIQRSKLRVDTRLRVAALLSSKWSPRDRKEVSGKDGGPVQVEDVATARAAVVDGLEAIAARRANVSPSKNGAPVA